MSAIRFGEDIDRLGEGKFINQLMQIAGFSFVILLYLFLSVGIVPCFEVMGRGIRSQECSVDWTQLDQNSFLLALLILAAVVLAGLYIRRYRLNQIKIYQEKAGDAKCVSLLRTFTHS